MRYLDSLSIWFWSFVIPPFFALIAVSGSLQKRARTFAKLVAISFALMIAAVGLITVSIGTAFIPGGLFAIWGMPVLAIAASIQAILRSYALPADTDPACSDAISIEPTLLKWRRFVKLSSELGFSSEQIRNDLILRGVSEDQARVLVSHLPSEER